MKKMVSLVVVFSIILSTCNISFAKNDIIISGLYPIKGDKIRLMSFESNLDCRDFIQSENYLFKNESDKAQNIEIGLNKDNGIRLPKVRVADQEIQLREEKDKYSFNIDLDKGEYKNVDLSYEIRVNNAENDVIKYELEGLEKWHKDIVEFKMICDLQEYIYPETSFSGFLDSFNRIVWNEVNYFPDDVVYFGFDNSWKNNKETRDIRELGNRGEYIEAMEKSMEKYITLKKNEEYDEAYKYYEYMLYFAAEYYMSDAYSERYPKNKLGEILQSKDEEAYWIDDNLISIISDLTNYEAKNELLKGKVILLNIEKQPTEALVSYDEKDSEEKIKAEYQEKINRLTNELEEMAPNSGIYVPKLDEFNIVNPTGRDEYRIWNEYDYNRDLAWELKYGLEELGATIITIPKNNEVMSNKERIGIANENDVHMVISIGAETQENEGNYIVYPSNKYIKNNELYSICDKLAQYFDEALIKAESEYANKRNQKQLVDEKTIFNWSEYPIVGLKINAVDGLDYGTIVQLKYFLKNKIVEYFNDKEVQAYYKNHPRELERKELELVKEKLKTENKVTENEIMPEVQKENTMNNGAVLTIIGVSIAATAVAAVLTFVVIKLVKRLRRKKNGQKENISDNK